MKLPIDEQQILMCASENSELWQVASAIADVAPGTRESVIFHARRLLTRYLNDGWISLARWKLGDPSFEDPVVRDEVDEILLDDKRWSAPSGPLDENTPVVVLQLTALGENAMDRGAAADAFKRFSKN